MKKKKPSPVSILGLFIWFIGALFFLYEFFLRTFPGTVAHEIIPDLHLNAETFAIVGSAYYVAYGLMQVPVGILADRFGIKKIMFFAILVCSSATFLFAHSYNFTTALISRFLMGFGSSFAFVCLLVIAVTWFPKRFFGFFAGFSQFIGTMGPLLAAGPLITFMQASHETWRNALVDISLFGFILSIFIILFVKVKSNSREKSLLVLNIEQPLSMRIKKLLQNSQAWHIALYSATVYISIALLGAFWGTDYLQTRGLSQVSAADMISAAWLGYAIACPLLGALSDIAKRRKPFLVLCAVLGLISTAGITYLPLNNSTWIYSILFAGLGIAASGQNLGFAAISEQTDPSTKATALGLNNGTITLSGAIFPPIVSYFIYIAAGGNHSQLTPQDFFIGFSIMPILCFVSIIISFFFIKETYCRSQKEIIKLKIST